MSMGRNYSITTTSQNVSLSTYVRGTVVDFASCNYATLNVSVSLGTATAVFVKAETNLDPTNPPTGGWHTVSAPNTSNTITSGDYSFTASGLYHVTLPYPLRGKWLATSVRSNTTSALTCSCIVVANLGTI